MSAILISGSLLAAQVHGSGFALIENSGTGMGNAFAGGSANAEDASTVFFNPAGMMKIKSEQFVFVGHAIMPKAKFSNSGSELADSYNGQLMTGDQSADGGQNALVPNIYYVRNIEPGLKFGLGINVPFGLSVKYDDDWIGRYHAVESELSTLNINPAIAYNASEKLSLGFGVSLISAEVILSSAVDFGALILQPQQQDGFVYIEGDNSGDLSYGWNAGLLYDVSGSTRIGIAYRSKIENTLTGTADFTVPGAMSSVTDTGLFTDSNLSSDVTFPDTLSLSTFHKYNESLEVMADITWTGWGSFRELRIKYDNPAQPDSVTTEEWKNTLRYAIGMNYRGYPKWVIRAGIAYDETPVPNSQRRTPRIPDNNRLWLSFGGGYQLNESMLMDFGYSHLSIRDVDIDNEFEASSPQLGSTLKGTYDSSVDILSLQLTWNLN